MSDEPGTQEERASSPRGEAAWKAAKKRVAERNEQARKSGKQRRGALERQRAAVRAASERRQMVELLARQGKR
jgi:hypothetical protein